MSKFTPVIARMPQCQWRTERMGVYYLRRCLKRSISITVPFCKRHTDMLEKRGFGRDK